MIGFWYHFAIMFEALFILTIIDAGTRVGRFMLQDLLGHVSEPLGRTSWMPGVIGSPARSLSAAGAIFCIRACAIRWAASTRCGRCSVLPINCWPRSRCAWRPPFCSRCTGARYMWITCVPLVWLVTVTFTAALEKIFSPVPAIGFLAQVDRLAASAVAHTAATQTLIFNARLDAALCGILLLMVATILLDSLRVWYGILRGTHEARVAEAPFVISQLRAEEL